MVPPLKEVFKFPILPHGEDVSVVHKKVNCSRTAMRRQLNCQGKVVVVKNFIIRITFIGMTLYIKKLN